MKMLQRYIGDQMVVCEVEQINAEGKGRWFGVWDGEPQDTSAESWPRQMLRGEGPSRQEKDWSFLGSRNGAGGRHSDHRSTQGRVQVWRVPGSGVGSRTLWPVQDRLLGGGSGAERVWAEERLINQSTLGCCVEKRLEGTKSVPRVRDRMTVARTGVVVGRWEK